MWNNKHHPKDIEPNCRKSLEELGLDYVDLFLMHYPHAYQRGEELFPADENGKILESTLTRDLSIVLQGYL